MVSCEYAWYKWHIMMTNWEEVPRGDIVSQAAGIHVTLNPKGLIALSRVTHEMMRAPPAYLLLYDKANCRIGLKPCAPNRRNAYPVGVRQQGAKTIRAFRLMRQHQITVAAAIEFHDARIDEQGILVLDLRTAKVSNRAGRHMNRND